MPPSQAELPICCPDGLSCLRCISHHSARQGDITVTVAPQRCYHAPSSPAGRHISLVLNYRYYAALSGSSLYVACRAYPDGLICLPCISHHSARQGDRLVTPPRWHQHASSPTGRHIGHCTPTLPNQPDRATFGFNRNPVFL